MLLDTATQDTQDSQESQCFQDTLDTLSLLLQQIPFADCVVILGDLNISLPKNIKGLTGKWALCDTPPTTNASKFLDLMRLHEITAASTFFQPKKNKSVATYLGPPKPSSNLLSQSVPNSPDTAEDPFINRSVTVKYRGKLVKGVIVKQQPVKVPASECKWLVEFEDGYY